jgi:uracil-DNA glycosylase
MDPNARQQIQLNGGADLQGFRQALRILIWCSIPSEQATWSICAEPDLFGSQKPAAYGAAGKPIILPRPVADLIRAVVCHNDPEKYAWLYELVWRMRRPKDPEPHLYRVANDPLVGKLNLMAKSVSRDIHRMRASLRFREVNDPVVGERFVAWFEPEHFILEEASQFFIDRFGSLDWTILTPKGSLWWDRKELAIGLPASRSDTPEADADELGWRTCYQSTYNPAGANLGLMHQHMPKKYWRNLPERPATSQLVQIAASRVEEMVEQEATMPAKRSPQKTVQAMAAPKSLKQLNRIIETSEPFVEGSDKAVLGEGPLHADIAFVGEQPGDQEDLQGRPFVGPAGKLLDKAMEEAGIDRKKAYVTNAVKHFKFVWRGKRRLHQSPTAAEIKHYRWWLEKELDFVQPRLVVSLGATAAHALAGKSVPIGKNRGPAKFGERSGYVTVHPSFLLRVPDEDRAKAYKAFVADLKRIHTLSAKAKEGR